MSLIEQIYNLFHEKLPEDANSVFSLTFWSDRTGQLSIVKYATSPIIEDDILIFHDLEVLYKFISDLTEEDICKLRT